MNPYHLFSPIYTYRNNKGFTFVELLIVTVLILFLLTLSVPFVNSVRADVSLMHSAKQVKSDLLASLSYGASGKSFAALSKNDLLNPNLIPSHYALHFKVATHLLDPPIYFYQELRSEGDSGNLNFKSLYEMEKELPMPATYFKSIRVKKFEEEAWKEVQSVWVIFVPPFGKILLIPGDSMASVNAAENQSVYDSIELELAYEDDPESVFLILDVNKNLRVE